MAESNSKFLANSMSMRRLSATPAVLLQSSVQGLLTAFPIQESYDKAQQKGVFSGYTSLAFTLIQLSRLHPEVKVGGMTLRQVAAQYIESLDSYPEFKENAGGLHCERTSVHVLRACVSGTEADLQTALADAAQQAKIHPELPDELLYGRAGILYLLRLLRFWVPHGSTAIDAVVADVVQQLLARKQPGGGGWTFVGKRYFGASHGDVGILTQIVLSKPSAAPRLEALLSELLDLQQENGNWPSHDAAVRDGNDRGLVQFCHGAPGFVISLKAIRHAFPTMAGRIDNAIQRGESIVWEQGLSKKEPSLCHGIFGNAL